jgi:hypothetical protein
MLRYTLVECEVGRINEHNLAAERQNAGIRIGASALGGFEQNIAEGSTAQTSNPGKKPSKKFNALKGPDLARMDALKKGYFEREPMQWARHTELVLKRSPYPQVFSRAQMEAAYDVETPDPRS